jgi:hypothetical protein
MDMAGSILMAWIKSSNWSLLHSELKPEEEHSRFFILISLYAQNFFSWNSGDLLGFDQWHLILTGL